MLKTLDKVLLSDNATQDFYKQYQDPEFKSWLVGILPEIEDAKQLKQDNPWHVYGCLDHILHSVESINSQTKDLDDATRRQLAYTMFLHDIGKPETHLRRYSKLYGREIDSFFNHNKASVKIADRVLGQFGFDADEQTKIKHLVHEHDIFMFITLDPDNNKHHKALSYPLVQELVDSYDNVGVGSGKELLSQLIMVGRADNLAQNPEMTQNSLKLLDKMDNMLTQDPNQTPVQ